MRSRLLLGAVLAASLTACKDVEFRRGLPVIAKPVDGQLVSGVYGQPDIARGNQARLAGRSDDAIRDLKPLAEAGYPEAELYLAAVYDQQPSSESAALAIRWYRSALVARPEAAVPLARALLLNGKLHAVKEAEHLLLDLQARGNDPQVDAGLLDLYAVFPNFDTQKRAPALAEKSIHSPTPGVVISAINWYRNTVIDQTTAKRVLDLCKAHLDADPECYIDLAAYYRYRGDHTSLTKLVADALKAFDLRQPVKYVDTLDFVPIDLSIVAGRLAIALVEQPDNEDLTEQAEDLKEQHAEEETLALASAEDNSDDKAAPEIDSTSADVSTVASPQPAAPTVTAEPELASSILRWMLKRPGTMKVEAAGVVVAYPYLLTDVDIGAVLSQGVTDHIPRASLFLGQYYFFNQRVPREADLTEVNLTQALKYRETNVPAHYRLGRLYQQGYLGRPEPAKSVEHFLIAARHRVTSADTHLARLFYDSPGTRVNRVNSYVFAKLADDAGYPVVVRTLRSGSLNVYKLLDRLQTDLTPRELETAEAMYQKERVVHLITPRLVGPEIWIPETPK